MIICYTVPEIRCMDIILFHLELFFPLLPPLRPLTFETPGDIINLHNCTKNYDYRLYCSWDMVCECNCYFSFTLGYFLPSPPLTTQKVKISKQKVKKKCLEISSFYTCVPKIMIRYCMVPEIWCVMDGWKKWHTEVGVPLKNGGHIVMWVSFYSSFDVN